jgi:FMN-dependent oxidoreductase (nitrilotriacetate monooxygenase family)
MPSQTEEDSVSREIHLGVFVLGTGNHLAGWRHPGATDSFQSLKVLQLIAQIAERGKFDLLFLGDSLGVSPNTHPSYMVRPDPLLILSAIAATTSHVGLGATASTTYSEPYIVARQFASLDHLSGGRAAWNAVTTSGPVAAGNFGRKHPNHDQRYEIAEEFVKVVKDLWDCWDDDAIVADRASGLYLDWSKVRPLNHEGTHFSVKGPLNVGRPPQGHPVILQAGGSESGQELAARTADIVFTVVQDFDEAKAAYGSFKERLKRHGRAAEDVCLLPGIMPVIGRTDGEARDKLNQLQSYVDDSAGIGLISSRLGQDLRGFSLDDPVPDLPLPDSSHGFARALLGKARREKMTLRDLYNMTAAARGHYVLCGSPQTIADTLEKWFVEGAADGFNIMPAYFPGAFDDFVDLVVPELQRRGLYRKDYTGTTLRNHLGLSRPEARRPS